MATHIVLLDKEELKPADMQAEVGDPTIPGKLVSTVAAAAPTQGATDIVRPSWPGMTNPGNRPVGDARPKVQSLNTNLLLRRDLSHRLQRQVTPNSARGVPGERSTSVPH